MKKIAKKPVAFCVVTGIVLPLLALAMAAVLAGIALAITKGSMDDVMLYNAVLDVLIVVLMALWVKKALGEGFVYGLGRKGMKLSLLLVAPLLIESLFYVASGMLSYINTELSAGDFLIPLITGLQPGITEEIFYRGMVFGGLMHIRADKKNRVLVAFLASTLLFALIHMINMIDGQSLIGTVNQILFVTAMGSLFAAAYLRSRNLWGPIILHSFHDAFAMFLVRAAGASSDGAASLVQIAIYIAVTVFACTIVFSTKPELVDELWGAAKTEEEEPAAATAL